MIIEGERGSGSGCTVTSSGGHMCVSAHFQVVLERGWTPWDGAADRRRR